MKYPKKKKPAVALPAHRFAFIAHELKGTLAAAMQNLYALKDGYFGAVSDEQKKIIATSLTYLGYFDSMMKNLFMFERIGEKMFVPVLRPTTLDTVILPAAASIRTIAEQRRLTIGTDIAPGIIVPADSGMLAAAIMNILGNAASYASAGGCITVRAVAQASRVTIDIYNDGTPIAARDVKKLFRKFSRLDRDADHIAGTGLGLFIARAIIKKHRGSIACVPRSTGNSFVITLPLSRT
ncbi:MAG: HAMP domain-containing sensor histidine kinase [Spirochaetota bacterium]